jgi:2-C-methyl-D-erythritol 4-phosphate cytidylyltransferase
VTTPAAAAPAPGGGSPRPGAVWTIVVAGGSGSRFGGEVPKQYRQLGDGRVLDHSLAAARAAGDGVVLVVGAGFADRPEPLADVVVVGGATRSDSVRAGLAALPDDGTVEVVLVHDGARPLASSALFERVVAAVRAGADGAVPAVPVSDTIKRIAGGVVVETPAREALVAVQTPQGFRFEALRSAHAGGGEATDDAALVEAAGGRVVVVPGEPANRKVTTPHDLATMAAAAGAGGAGGAAAGPDVPAAERVDRTAGTA